MHSNVASLPATTVMSLGPITIAGATSSDSGSVTGRENMWGNLAHKSHSCSSIISNIDHNSHSHSLLYSFTHAVVISNTHHNIFSNTQCPVFSWQSNLYSKFTYFRIKLTLKQSGWVIGWISTCQTGWGCSLSSSKCPISDMPAVKWSNINSG